MAALPTPRNRFFGRQAELAAISARFEEGVGGRLVTVLGPVGVGKSRLAIEWAHRRGPATHVDLEGATDAPSIMRAVGAALDVDPEAARASPTLVTARLEESGSALILDPFDHLVPHGPATVGRWLEASSACRILAVSTIPLHLEGERRVLVRALPPPEAEALFRERLSALSIPHDPALDPHVTRIVTALDGLPLAIVLAAGRATTLSLPELAHALEESHALLRSRRADAPPRHASMDAAVGRVTSLLSEGERSALARLSIFPESFDRRAAEVAVGPAPAPGEAPLALLERLVERSLVARVDTPTGYRLRVYSPVRAAMRRELDPEAARAVVERVAKHYASRFDVGAERAMHPDHEAELAPEVENLLDVGARVTGRDPETAARLYVALNPYFRRRIGFGTEGRVDAYVARFEETVRALDADHPCSTSPAHLRARMTLAAIWIRIGHLDDAEAVFTEIIASTRRDPALRPFHAEATNQLATARWTQGRIDEAETLWDSIREMGEPRVATMAANNLALLALEREDPEAARAHLESAPALSPDDPLVPKVQHLLAWAHVFSGEAAQATTCFDAAASADDEEHALARAHLGRAIHAMALDDLPEASAALSRAEEAMGDAEPFMRPALRALHGVVAALGGDRETATAERKRSLAGRPTPADGGWSADDARALLAVADAFLARRLDAGPTPRVHLPERRFLPDRYLELVLTRSDDTGDAARVTVDRGGRYFQLGDAEPVSLRRMPLLARLLEALAETRHDSPGAPVPTTDLVERGWPGERILPDAASTRLYQAIKRLRNLGLGDALLSSDGGYRLDEARCVLSDDTSA